MSPFEAHNLTRLLSQILCGCVAAAVGVVALSLGLAAFLRPDVPVSLREVPEDVRIKAQERYNPRLSARQPPTIVQDVDYTEGKQGEWWPKGESPLLAGLVRDGVLPPVADRTGPEPVVMAGTESEVGSYGGTWHRLGSSTEDVEAIIGYRLSYAGLVRWSPQGYPIVPHLAKSWAASPDQREWTLVLREGLRWSDGAPFTTDDIMFWWRWEARYFQSGNANFNRYTFMIHAGRLGRIEQVDSLTLKFIFADSHGMFLEELASTPECFRPAHYVSRFHPEIGDRDLISQLMQNLNLPSSEAVYVRMVSRRNPEHPRMWPWIYADYRSSAPHAFVRNPYYYAVDPRGNQLPYLDRVLFGIKNPEMITAAVANGEVSMQGRLINFEDYTLLSSQSARRGYSLRHWYSATRSMFMISPNLNRRVDPDDPDAAWKRRLVNEKSFRQALSLAINRREIIDAVYNGVGEPAQSSPGPDSAYGDERHFRSFTEYDPGRAAALLDGMRLDQTDAEGYRTFPDGRRMTWFLNLSSSFPSDSARMVATHWAGIGIRAIVQVHPQALWQVEFAAQEHDFTVWPGLEEYMPMLDPRYYVPITGSSFFAPAWGRWYQKGGLYGDPEARPEDAPPKGHPVRRAMELYRRAQTAPSAEERIDYFHEILEIAAENVWTISVATPPPVLVAVANEFRNVPEIALAGSYFMTPGNTGMETYYWTHTNDRADAAERIQQSLVNPSVPWTTLASEANNGNSTGGRLLSTALWLLLGLSLLLIAIRHPLIWHRMLTLVPTLLIISVLVFTIVQLPPGDFIASKTVELGLSGESNAAAQLEDIRRNFHLDEPVWEQYARWMGIKWFGSFDPSDTGLLQGNLGRSMQSNFPVNEILGDRIVLSFVISVCTILFTWAVALPIGIFSAARPYTLADYALTLIGFVGMSVPPFLFALVLMYLSSEYLGIAVSGLFSVRYASDPTWSLGKLVDLLQHVWVPVVVLGTGSTAVMIRVMRANLMDELKKPYVMAAQARGLRPFRLLLKYPVRIALNPFVSGLAGLFPQIVSGGAIVAVVLSLPTIGPVMLEAILAEDVYLAASLLMILSALGAIGTLLSDLILLWLDPRIRIGGGTR